MFPIRDNIPPQRTALVNYLLILICLCVFIVQLKSEYSSSTMVEEYGFIPLRLSHPEKEVEIVTGARIIRTMSGNEVEYLKRPAVPAQVSPFFTMVTCVFLHGSLMHLLGNMLFLYIFGDNVEDRLGHIGYLCFFLLSGLVASSIHYVSEPNSMIPTIGASGAIAGVMGAYLFWYPDAKIQTLIPLGFILQFVLIPAPFFLIVWFLIQLYSGFGTLGGAESGGVAWWAHIGGFVFGASFALLARNTFFTAPQNDKRTAAHQPVRLLRR